MTIQFACSEAKAAYAVEFRQARESQRSRFAVAPRVQLGKFQPGDAIEMDDVRQFASSPTEPVWSVMARLVSQEKVIEISPAELAARQTPEDARFVLAPGRSIITAKRGIVPAGCQVFEDDWQQPGRLSQLVAAGVVVDRHASGPQEAA